MRLSDLNVSQIRSKALEQAFQVTSGALRVTDPCYEMDVWCAETIEDVRNGTWLATTGFDQRGNVACLMIRHESAEAIDSANASCFRSTDQEDVSIGVDSGQAGFFDLAPYKAQADTRGDASQDTAHSAFYNRVCEITNAKKAFGVIEFGAVSRSGYGDGDYRLLMRRDAKGSLIAAMIAFIEA